MSKSYRQAGVDVQLGDDLVDWLQDSNQKSTQQKRLPHQERVVSGIGGFAALFDMPFEKYEKPLVVTCTDGVGTKVKIASEYSRFSTIGQDLVAMCVNDLICTGGDPYLFLDYYAVGKLELNKAQDFLSGVQKACFLSDCHLIGGETAEMPGVYIPGDMDCAGFAVGLVSREKVWGAHLVKPDDMVIGIESSGFHSNGYSLLRKVFADDLSDWVDELLKPTHLYVDLNKKVKTQIEVHAAAHITGGGIQNIDRVLPKELKFELKPWEWPNSFREVQKRIVATDQEMLETLNCGVGFCYVISASQKNKLIDLAKESGFKAFEIGRIVEG